MEVRNLALLGLQIATQEQSSSESWLQLTADAQELCERVVPPERMALFLMEPLQERKREQPR